MARGNFNVVVAGMRQLTLRVREYALRSADGTPLPDYSAGAHVAVHTLSAERGPIVRHYSLVGGADLQDDPRNTYRIAVQREEHSRGSAHIHAIFQTGTPLQIGPPVNNFPLDRRDNQVLLIAGGIGITPIYSMVRSLTRRHRPYKVVYAGRNAESMAYREELALLAGDRARFHTSDSQGRLDLQTLLAGEAEGTTLYICGPAKMIEATQEAAARLNWAAGKVRSEMFGAGGDVDHADETRVPDTSWLDSPDWKSVRGSFYLKSDYVSMHENLLDQTHFPFLHPGAVGTPEYARSKLKVRMVADAVVIDRELRNSPPPGIYGVPTGLTGKPVDRFSDARFVSPALHTAYARIVDNADPGGEPRTYRFNITHLFTPETNHSIHYWWFNSRNFNLQDTQADDYLLAASAKAYLEDVDALEWIMQAVRGDVEPQFDLNFAPDKPGLMMRQVLHQLAAAEAGVQI